MIVHLRDSIRLVGPNTTASGLVISLSFSYSTLLWQETITGLYLSLVHSSILSVFSSMHFFVIPLPVLSCSILPVSPMRTFGDTTAAHYSDNLCTSCGATSAISGKAMCRLRICCDTIYRYALHGQSSMGYTTNVFCFIPLAYLSIVSFWKACTMASGVGVHLFSTFSYMALHAGCLASSFFHCLSMRPGTPHWAMTVIIRAMSALANGWTV